MESEDLINLPASSNSGNESENNDLPSADCELGAADSLPNNSEIKENQLNGDFPGNEDDIGNKSIQSLPVPESDKDLIDTTTIVQVTVELGEAVEVQEKMNCFNSTVHTENGSVTVQDGSLLGNLKRDGSSISSQEKDISCILFFMSLCILNSVLTSHLEKQYKLVSLPQSDSIRILILACNFVFHYFH